MLLVGLGFVLDKKLPLFKVMFLFANHSLEVSDRVDGGSEIWTTVSLAEERRTLVNVSPLWARRDCDDGDFEHEGRRGNWQKRRV